MGKNGHKPQDILTLEEALIRFKRKRDEARAHAHTNGKTHPDSNVRYADFSATVKREGAETSATESKPPENRASAQAQRHDANAAEPAGEDVVAVIGGISRTLQELEHLATADRANRDVVYAHQFEDAEVVESYTIPVARRPFFSRDYGFTLMGTALMTLVAVVVMRAPILGEHARPTWWHKPSRRRRR